MMLAYFPRLWIRLFAMCFKSKTPTSYFLPWSMSLLICYCVLWNVILMEDQDINLKHFLGPCVFFLLCISADTVSDKVAADAETGHTCSSWNFWREGFLRAVALGLPRLRAAFHIRLVSPSRWDDPHTLVPWRRFICWFFISCVGLHPSLELKFSLVHGSFFHLANRR